MRSNPKSSRSVFVAKGIAIGLAPFLTCGPLHAEKAYHSEEFVNSIGVVTHWNYLDTPYGQRYIEVRDKLVESGIRNVRDMIHQNRPQELGKLGIRYLVFADVYTAKDGGDADIAKIVSDIKFQNSQGALIDAVEGPNESDLFWTNPVRTYKGKGVPEGPMNFQKDLYAAIKSGADTKGIKVIGLTLGKTYDPGAGINNPFQNGSLEAFVDYGGFHPYPGGNPWTPRLSYATLSNYHSDGNHPSCIVGEYPYAFNVYQPPFGNKPMVATETGYSTYANGVSEKIHAKYIPRLFLEHFRLGVVRTYSYEFLDEFSDPGMGDREAHFGLLRRDLTPKPAYHAVKNLIGLLKDPGSAFVPDSLPFQMKVTPPADRPEYTRTQYVHHLLLQKRSGTFYLVLWHEIANTDKSASPAREIVQPSMPTKLVFGVPMSKATLHSLEEDGTLSSKDIVLTDNGYALDVGDRPVILELTPKSGTGIAGGPNGRSADSRAGLSSQVFRTGIGGYSVGFSMARKGKVGIRILTPSGGTVLRVAPGELQQGYHRIGFDMKPPEPGLYYVHLDDGRGGYIGATSFFAH